MVALAQVSSIGGTSSQQIDGFVQDSSNSSALAMELLQSCTKPLKYAHHSYIKKNRG